MPNGRAPSRRARHVRMQGRHLPASCSCPSALFFARSTRLHPRSAGCLRSSWPEAHHTTRVNSTRTLSACGARLLVTTWRVNSTPSTIQVVHTAHTSLSSCAGSLSPAPTTPAQPALSAPFHGEGSLLERRALCVHTSHSFTTSRHGPTVVHARTVQTWREMQDARYRPQARWCAPPSRCSTCGLCLLPGLGAQTRLNCECSLKLTVAVWLMIIRGNKAEEKGFLREARGGY